MSKYYASKLKGSYLRRDGDNKKKEGQETRKKMEYKWEMGRYY